MEELKNNKKYLVIFWIFIVFSVLHIIYATITMRGMYEDASFYILSMLQNMADGNVAIIYDSHHPRCAISFLTQIPVYFSHFVLGIDNKFILLKIYSLILFLFPFLALLWNFQLTKRTKRIDVLFWSIFSYGLLLLPCMIFAVVEFLIGATFHFILMNYLVSDIDYKKRDILLILFLLSVMFLTYEYVVLLGLIIFVFHFRYALNPTLSRKNKLMKYIIGFGSLGASIFNIIFMLHIPGESGEINRFLSEAYDFLPLVFELNSLFTISTIFFLLVFIFVKKEMSSRSLLFILIVFLGLLTKLLLNKYSSVYPVWEQHFRTIPCWALPLIFAWISVKDIIFKNINYVKYTNYIILVLICSIFQTIWQCVNTYYWDKNIQYMKQELKNEPSSLYVPSQHEELSGFHNIYLRRYIWHGVYSATSILFSDTKKQKTLLMVYDEPIDEGNIIERSNLYSDLENGKISIPFGVRIDIKNKFWDLTNVAIALDEYNEKNNIKTNK